MRCYMQAVTKEDTPAVFARHVADSGRERGEDHFSHVP